VGLYIKTPPPVFAAPTFLKKLIIISFFLGENTRPPKFIICGGSIPLKLGQKKNRGFPNLEVFKKKIPWENR